MRRIVAWVGVCGYGTGTQGNSLYLDWDRGYMNVYPLTKTPLNYTFKMCIDCTIGKFF